MVRVIDRGNAIVAQDGEGCYAMKVLLLVLYLKLYSLTFFLELNYCENNPDTCKNGAKCVSLIKDDGNYRCLCREGSSGRNCEESEYLMTPVSLNATTTTTTAPSVTVAEEQPVLMETSTKYDNETESTVATKKKSKNKFLTGNEAY